MWGFLVTGFLIRVENIGVYPFMAQAETSLEKVYFQNTKFFSVLRFFGFYSNFFSDICDI